MALMLKFAARSDVGKVRSKNDDSAYVGRYLAVVADGMGGHVGGDVASASTVLDLVHLDVPETPDPETVLPDEIQAANLVLERPGQRQPEALGDGHHRHRHAAHRATCCNSPTSATRVPTA